MDPFIRDVDSLLENHAVNHITAGGDEIDGDQLDIDWNPAIYTPATTPAQVTSVDHLTAHLYGIDQSLAVGGTGSLDHAYNNGRTITVDAGAIVLNQSTATNAQEINQSGAGSGLAIALSSDLTNQAITVTESNAIRTTPMVELTRQANATGGGVLVTMAGGGGAAFSMQDGTNQEAFFEAREGQNSAVSAASVGRLIYNSTTNTWQVSANTGAYINLALGGGGGPVTLDDAYNGGRTITVDAGAVVLNQSTGTNALEVNQTGAGDAIAITLATDLTNQALVVTEDNVVRTSSMIEVTRQANATGRVIDIDNNGAGAGIYIAQGSGSGTAAALQLYLNGASTTDRGIYVTETAVARSATMMSLARNAAASGNVANLINAGSGNALGITQSGAGGAINISLVTSLVNQAINVTEDNVIRTTPVVAITTQANRTGTVFTLTAQGTGVGIQLNQSGAADAFQVAQSGVGHGISTLQSGVGSGHRSLLSVSLLAQAFVATEDDVARSTAMVQLTRQASATGHVLDITNTATATSRSIDIVHTGSATAVNIAMSGGGTGLGITHTGTAGIAIAVALGTDLTNQGLVITEDNVVRTTAMMSLTTAANRTGHALSITSDAAATSRAIDVTHTGTAAAVSLAIDTALTNQALVITEDNVVRTTSMIELTGQASRTGALATLTNPGSGNALTIAQSGAADAVNVALATSLVNQALVCTEDNIARSAAMVSLTGQANRTGHVLYINNAATATSSSVNIAHAGTGACVLVANSGASNAIHVTQSGAGVIFRGILDTSLLAYGINITEDDVARSVPMVSLVGQANRTGNILAIVNPSSAAAALSITQSSVVSRDAIAVALSNALGNQALVITEDNVARSVSMVELTGAASRTGHVLAITNAATASSSSISVVHAGSAGSVNVDNNGTGDGIYVAQGSASGAAAALNLLLNGASATTRGIYLAETAVARSNPMVTVIRDAAASGSLATLTNPGSGNALTVAQSGAADAVNVALATSLLNQALVITEDNVARSSAMIELTGQASRTGNMVLVTNPGAGNSIDINHSGAGDSLNVALATSLLNQALVVTEDNVARSTAMVQLTGQANRTGPILDITAGAAVGITVDGQMGSELFTLTDAATIATDCNTANSYVVTITDDRAMGAPTNGVAGFIYTWIVKQDGSGGHTLDWSDAAFKFPGGTEPVVAAGADDISVIHGIYDGSNFLLDFHLDYS
jgi:hypothetical protein